MSCIYVTQSSEYTQPQNIQLGTIQRQDEDPAFQNFQFPMIASLYYVNCTGKVQRLGQLGSSPSFPTYFVALILLKM